MATKRKLTVKVPPPDQEWDIDEQLKPALLRRDRGWRDWLLRDYLRYWYFMGCLFADVLIVMEVWRNIDIGLSTSVPLIVLTALVIGEFLGYLSLWGNNGKWRKK
jgi:uncharacterized membrane protein YdcZ (DUF606 family)